ncbi:unnamed protein product [Fraxinus pennsylvanica]|uniref:Uncharacterized protein n=1 Tax=Fraxinus pennsylvanica TaxID=56036 RepID=A0AAD2DK14_9LAMI|nr:unnamed protein product [Fraxinus pennsylvanica]
MGSNFCCFPSSGFSKKNSDDKNGSLTASMLECMKPRCLLATSKIKKQSHRQENQQKHQQQLRKNNCEVLTLEEWILSSPGFNVPKQCPSNRVHPSFEGDHEDLVPESRDNISLEISMKIDEGEKGKLENSSVGRNQSGKMKKKVSFRSPEVAEIFILYPQQTYS